jgi:membrane associated rhomboid family serine protease
MGYRFNSGETPAVYMLLAAMGIIFLVDFYLHNVLTFILLWPVTLGWLQSLHLWNAFTFPFVHGGSFNALLTDLLMLFFIGRSLEQAWGWARFTFFFFFSGLLAGMVVLVLSPLTHAGGLFVGMVGSFLAISVAFATLTPNSTILLFFVLPMPAWTIAALGVAIELFYRSPAYGGPLPASIAIAVVGLFAFAFTRGRFALGNAFRFGGPGLRERVERWRQRRRMRQWQRRVSRADRPEDLFKDR